MTFGASHGPLNMTEAHRSRTQINRQSGARDKKAAEKLDAPAG